MPGIRLKIDKEKVVGADMPTSADEVKNVDPRQMTDAPDRSKSNDGLLSIGAAMPTNGGGLAAEARKIGMREGRESKQDGSYEDADAYLRDMAEGILENEGVLSANAEQGERDRLISAFQKGWRSVSA